MMVMWEKSQVRVKKKKMHAEVAKKIDHASICHGLARQCSWRYDTISARMATQL